MNQRNLLVSFLQAWGIILVVLGHSFYYSDNNPIHTWIYSFHMPLFMFISGFLLRYGVERKNINLSETKMLGLDGFVWNKVKRLLIPWVVISSIAYLPKVMMSRFAARPIDLSIDSYINMFLYPYTNAIQFFWFLPTLFLIFIVVLCIVKSIRKAPHAGLYY